MSNGRVILVAFHIESDDANGVISLLEALPRPGTAGIEAWWQAEDDRIDGSDNDSAVFVNPGMQKRAWSVLYGAGLTAPWNTPPSHEDETRLTFTEAAE